MIKLTGLWENTTKQGETYFRGNLGLGQVLIFKNKYKKTDKDPDYVMYLAEKDKKEETPSDPF
jgi:hypothetical protein